jgi:3-(3-hydroxy-phenyl)propionate hydroxylase
MGFQPDSMPGYKLPVYEYRRPAELEGRSLVYPVIVVGAGLAGLTAALELTARGIRTVLLDDDNTVGAAGLSSRGICYAKRTLEILDRFGVAARVRAKGVTWNEGEVFRGAELLYRFNLQPETDQKFPAFVNLQQFYVEQYLVEKAQAMGIDLRWKNKVVGVTQEKDFVLLEIDTPDGTYEVRASYVVAADGGHGAMRTLVAAEDEERRDYWLSLRTSSGSDPEFVSRCRLRRRSAERASAAFRRRGWPLFRSRLCRGARWLAPSAHRSGRR